MNKMPEVVEREDGSKVWEMTFEKFKAKVYIPASVLPSHIINYGFRAAYQLVFEENEMTMEKAVEFAKSKGMDAVAKEYAGSVVFVYPTSENGWKDAPEDFFASIIEQSRISQYYKDGVAIMWDRFNKCWGDYFIRGAVLRTCLYGYGASADFIAKTCLKTVTGQGLYGPGDITPACVVLENLGVEPVFERDDIPVVSVGNTAQMNEKIKSGSKHVLIKEKLNLKEDYKNFIDRYRRMVGYLNIEDNLDELGMTLDASSCMVTTAKDNRGDDKDTKIHEIGYLAYYNKSIANKKAPLVLCFHGGGDSAFCMATVTGWYQIAHKYGFYLVMVENHLNSTATEMQQFIMHLKTKYMVDETKIYSTGFSMGGCKSWDNFQEYPSCFAAVAPMDATFELGCNSYGESVEPINRSVIVPTYYIGGEITPLPELPFQAQKCVDRIQYVLQVNKAKKKYEVSLENKDEWENKIWGISGDKTMKLFDKNRNSTLTLELFESENGCCYSIFGSVSGQGHECRFHSCENAWLFMNQFTRQKDGSLTGGDFETIVSLYK